MIKPQSLMCLKAASVQILLTWLLVLPASPGLAHSLDETAVNIYGDGDPGNGVEDSRERIEIVQRNAISRADQRVAAGTVNCDGKIRGTAMVLDTREYAPSLKGVVLISAAHVLFDLKNGTRFKGCKFHFLGPKQQARYRVKISLEKVAMGDFDRSGTFWPPANPAYGPEGNLPFTQYLQAALLPPQPRRF